MGCVDLTNHLVVIPAKAGMTTKLIQPHSSIRRSREGGNPASFIAPLKHEVRDVQRTVS
jgi:hypothetical protein